MVSFSSLDIIIIVAFFLLVLVIGFIPRGSNKSEEYLLSGRKLGLLLFIMTNVATWYGGILGVGEFSYRYGIVSWFAQGFPYYVFAILFAVFFAKKIRDISLFTIPDLIEKKYGRGLSIISAILIFLLVSPAPYLLMVASLISMIFGIDLLVSLFIAAIFSTVYLFRGGFKSDVYTDVFEFFVMFIGFGVIVGVAVFSFGGLDFLQVNLPENHLRLTGGESPTFIIVWFLIALWTFADPGFHQRCYAAKSGDIAKRGIIISVFLWLLFDFLTTTTGLYSRAIIPDLENPVLSFPMLAERILGPGLKGLFYAALFATILSTLNSFLFISATTFSNDLVKKIFPRIVKNDITKFTRIGLFITAIISIIFAYYAQSVISLWYTIGSICIPGIIFVVISSYYDRFRLRRNYTITQVLSATAVSFAWWLVRDEFIELEIIGEIEPMILGITAAAVIQIFGKKERAHASP